MQTQTLEIPQKIVKTPQAVKRMGSDCAYCSLEEGVSCMIYFCKKKSAAAGKREICFDGFRGKCPDYKPC